jgi:hypothetical protein
MKAPVHAMLYIPYKFSQTHPQTVGRLTKEWFLQKSSQKVTDGLKMPAEKKVS